MAEVILEQVVSLLEEQPDNQLYISGHSLGGALATIFSLETAADERIPSPVTCITSGASKVGNIDFMLAYESLEKAKKLRCLHIANDRDPVTVVPPNGAFNPCHALLCQSRRFRHVGLRAILRRYGRLYNFVSSQGEIILGHPIL